MVTDFWLKVNPVLIQLIFFVVRQLLNVTHDKYSVA